MFFEIYILQVIVVSSISLVNGADSGPGCTSITGIKDGALIAQQNFINNLLTSANNNTCDSLPCATSDVVKFSSIKNGETEIRELQNLANIRNNIDLNAPISIIIQDIISPDLLADNEINVNLAKGVASYYNRNVILVNLDAITNQNYGCIANVIAPKVADYLADVILSLLQICRIDWNTLWIGGHGIGAHIAGLTSDRLPIKVKVCWALDPLGLLYDRGLAPGLRPCSCETVYAVYTSTALLGSRSQVGTINVYVNGAAVQPGCELFVVPLCSHIRAVLLDSVARQNPLNISSSAGSTFEFLNHEIPPGEYHLQTTGCLPFI